MNLTPGLDMMYVISRSMGLGRRAGVVSALGIGAGTLVHTFITALGLSLILITSVVAFDVVRYAGAVYLAYLGLRMLSGRSTIDSLESSEPAAFSKIFGQGVMTNVLNPKVALFFLAFLPQFVDRSKAIADQIVLLGIIFDTSGTMVNILVAVLAAYATAMLRGGRTVSIVQRWLPGVILIVLSLLVALK